MAPLPSPTKVPRPKYIHSPSVVHLHPSCFSFHIQDGIRPPGPPGCQWFPEPPGRQGYPGHEDSQDHPGYLGAGTGGLPGAAGQPWLSKAAKPTWAPTEVRDRWGPSGQEFPPGQTSQPGPLTLAPSLLYPEPACNSLNTLFNFFLGTAHLSLSFSHRFSSCPIAISRM